MEKQTKIAAPVVYDWPVGKKVKGSACILADGQVQFTPYKKQEGRTSDGILVADDAAGVKITYYNSHTTVAIRIPNDNLFTMQNKLGNLVIRAKHLLEKNFK